MSNILRVPQTQDVFGQGWGFWAATENGSWGPKLDGVVRPWGAPLNSAGVFDPAAYDSNTGMYDLSTGATPRYASYSYVKNNARNFYETGLENNQSIQISGGNESTSYNLSYNYTGVDGIIPTDADKYNRHMLSFRGTAKKGKLSADYSVNYVYKEMNAVSAGQGQSDGGATLWQELLQTPVSVDLTSLKDYTNAYNNSDNFYTWYASNPYFVINENGNRSRENRVYGKVELNYEITSGLKAIARLGGDFQNTRLSEWGAIESFSSDSWSTYGQKATVTGRYEEDYSNNQQLDATALLNYDYTLGEDWTITGNAGFNWNQISYSDLDSYVSGLNIPNWYSLANSSDRPISTSRSEMPQRRLYAALGEFTLGFKNFWFVSGSARNDWSSTLPDGKNSYFYGGLNTSVLLHEMFSSLKNSPISFWKVRAAVGQTGKDAAAYLTSNSYLSSQVTLRSGNLYLPLGGVAGLTESNVLGNSNLKPEITTEWELGTQINFFDNRVNWDITYYDKVTKDQIITANLGPETGYTRQTLNVGKIRNKGVEISLNLVPVRTKDFKWDFTTNFTRNRSKVEELWGGHDKYLLNSAYDVLYYAEVGKPLGSFYAPAAEVAPEKLADGSKNPYAGYTVVNSSTGRPLIADDPKYMGSSESDFMMGFTNKFKYKNWGFSFAIDWRQGGKFYSYTQQLLNFTGNSYETTFNERQPFLLPHSVKVDSKGNYVENDVNTTLTANYSYWYSNTNPVMYQHAVLDKTNVKLREVTISYSMPTKWFAGTSISGLDVTLYGRNLLLFTPSTNNFVDPEATNFGNDLSGEFGEFAAGPTTRTYGVNLRLSF
jgi:outer membrane receptor protein involved in Fe transport